MKPKRILLVGGGTGGHIIPHIPVVIECERLVPDVEFLYIGSRNPLDRMIVETHLGARIRFMPIFCGKLRRYFSWRHFLDPFLILLGFFQSLYCIARFRPDVIFLKGGYVSLPVVFAGWILRKRMILQESDAAIGLANRISAHFVERVLLAYPDAYDSLKAEWVGAPVRAEILEGDPAKGWAMTGFPRGKPVVLVMGGSLGARSINELILKAFPWIQHDLQVVHITGAGKDAPFSAPGYISFPYLDEDLKHIYAITDFIVARAGANTLAEIALLQKPNILIPLSGSAQGNQQKNAAYFAKAGASIVFEHHELTPRKLADQLLGFIKNASRQQSMRKALAALATPEAAGKIAGILLNSAGDVP